MKEIIEIFVRVIEGGFYLLTGVIALLTYTSAKRTILQPIKTEVFKYQVDVFSRIMKLFNGKGEYELRKLFGLDQMLRANIVKMVDSYGSIYFQWEIDEKKRPYNKKDCPSSIITHEYAEKYMMSPGLRRDDVEKENEVVVEKSKDAFWAEYIHGEICQPKQTGVMLHQLDEIIQSPFLTKESIRLLQKIKDTVMENTIQMGKVLTDVAKELPYLYPSAEELSKIDISWIENRYNNVFDSLDVHCNALTDYLRDYLKVENIME